VLTLTASGSVSDYSDTSILQARIATAAGVDKSLVTIEVAAASVIITATIAVPASTTATAVQALLSSTLGTAATASDALGITIESAPAVTSTDELQSSSSDSSSPVGIIVGVLAAAVVVSILVACFWRKRRQNNPKPVTLNNPYAGGAAPGGKPTKGRQMAVKDQKDLAQPGMTQRPEAKIDVI
jgi:hypothetical protein